MFIPVSCDAVLYHLPIGTVCLIVVNIVVLVAMAMGLVDPDHGWILMYGQGLHPGQWLLSIFTHAGFMHLLGNVFFLWTFGLVTEGKLGWARFLATYLLIGVGQSALEQLVMLHAQPAAGSIGASAAICGLMAMACVWAPFSEVKMVGTLGIYFFSFDVSIVLLSAIYIGMEIAWTVVAGSVAGTVFASSTASSLLHLSGAVLGGVLGVIMLKRGVVDCDHWDIFSVIRGEQGESTPEELAAPSAEQIASHQQKKAHESKQKILAYLHIGQAPQALQVLRKVRDMKLPLELDRQEQLKLIVGLDQHRQWADAAPLMMQFVEQFPYNSSAVRLRLAQICLVELQRPAKALELLAKLVATQLNEKQDQLRKKITAVARKQIADGAVELDEAL